jgi:cobalt-zinc-cadmium efflux system outer membrane protein
LLRADTTGATHPECRPGTFEARGDTLCLDRAGAVARALAENPNLAVAAALTAQARARKVQATAIPDPAFSAEWDESRGVFGRGGAGAKAVGATLTIPFPDKFRLQGRIGTADVRSAEADSVQAHQTIVALASATYDGLLAALRRRHDLRQIRSLAEDFVERTRGRLEAGTAARLDLLKAQVDARQAENDLIVAERDIVTNRASLNRLMGRPLDAGIATADSLALPPPPPPLDVVLAAAMGHRPELASLASQRQGARAASSLAKESWLPDFTVGIGRDYADPGPGVLTTGISLPIPIFYWQHARGEIAEARHHERELDATTRDLIAAIGEEVRTIWSTTDAALRQATFLREQLLPSAREAYRIAASSYALGGSSALEVLDARRSLLDAEQQYTDALLAANQSRADLERAAAVPLATLGTGVSP